MVTPDDAKEIASRGGGMVLDAGKFTPADLKEIASRANGKGAIYIRNAGNITPTDAKEIASRGGGSIVLDYT